MKLLQNGIDYVPQLPERYKTLPDFQHGHVVKLARKRGSKAVTVHYLQYLNEIAPILLR